MLNGFPTLYYEDVSPLFHSRPTCTDTLFPLHTILLAALSLSPFITLTQSVSVQSFADVLSHRRPRPRSHISANCPYYHIWRNWIKGHLNRLYLHNQISTIKTKLPLTLRYWISTPQTCSLMLLPSLCGAHCCCLGRRNAQKKGFLFFSRCSIHLQRSESCLMFYHGYTARSMMQNRDSICLWKMKSTISLQLRRRGLCNVTKMTKMASEEEIQTSPQTEQQQNNKKRNLSINWSCCFAHYALAAFLICLLKIRCSFSILLTHRALQWSLMRLAAEVFLFVH